jgi:hypothetical protein
VDEEGYAQLVDKIQNHKGTGGNPMTYVELTAIVNAVAHETAKRRGLSGLKRVANSLDRRTVDRILNDIPQFCIQPGQTTTKARQREAKDIRNFVTTGVMNECYAKDKPPHLLGNMDATQFGVQFVNNQLLVSIKGEKDDPLTFAEDSTLGLFIKWIYLLNASGYTGESVFLLADDSMTEDECNIHRVIGLTNNSDASAIGYMCFCRTRAGNLAFFKWYFLKIIVPFVQNCRQHILSGESEKLDAFFLVIDGEDIQAAILLDDEVREVFKDNFIDVGKGAASCSGVCGNAADLSNLFKSAKKTLKHDKKTRNLDETNKPLEQRIVNILAQEQPNISSAKRKLMAVGLVRVSRALSRVMNHTITLHGFDRIGVYCDLGDDKFGPSFLKCLSLCKNSSYINRDMINHIENKLPEMCELFMRDPSDINDMDGSQLTEFEMDTLGIPKDNQTSDRRTSPKDARPQCNQRAMMLTADVSIRRRKIYIENQKAKKVAQEVRREEKTARDARKVEDKREKERGREEKMEMKAEQKMAKQRDKELRKEVAMEAKAMKRQAREDKKHANEVLAEAKIESKKRAIEVKEAKTRLKVAKAVIASHANT